MGISVCVGDPYLRVSECVDDIGQGEERAIDVGSFPEASSFSVGGAGLLRTSQVNQTHLGHTHAWIETSRLILLPQVDLPRKTSRRKKRKNE